MSLILPKSLKVTRSPHKERELVSKLRSTVEAFERTAESPIHVSDLLSPCKAYWQRIKPKKFSDSSIMYFSLGYSGHEFLLGNKDSGSRVSGDLCWSPDGETDTAIIEIKITTKRTIATTRSELDKYIQQVMAYMSLEGKNHGEIWVWYVSAYEYPKLVVFKVEATDRQLKSYKKQIEKNARALRKALLDKDHTSLSLCEKNLCCRSRCSWYDDCRPAGRWKEKRADEKDIVREI